MLAADLGTWLDTIGIKKEESESGMVKDWNTDRNGKEREIMNNQTI